MPVVAGRVGGGVGIGDGDGSGVCAIGAVCSTGHTLVQQALCSGEGARACMCA